MEFALVVPIFVLMAVAIFNIGVTIQQRVVLQQAVRAAGWYALSFPNQTDSVSQIVLQALPASWTDVTVSTATCYCASTSHASGPCATVCGTGSYVVITAERASTYSSLPYAIFGNVASNCPDNTGNCASYVVRFQ